MDIAVMRLIVRSRHFLGLFSRKTERYKSPLSDAMLSCRFSFSLFYLAVLDIFSL